MNIQVSLWYMNFQSMIYFFYIFAIGINVWLLIVRKFHEMLENEIFQILWKVFPLLFVVWLLLRSNEKFALCLVDTGPWVSDGGASQDSYLGLECQSPMWHTHIPCHLSYPTLMFLEGDYVSVLKTRKANKSYPFLEVKDVGLPNCFLNPTISRKFLVLIQNQSLLHSIVVNV